MGAAYLGVSMDFFSTRGLPAARKVSFWNSISSEVFAAMEIAPRDPQAFDGQIRRESLGALTLMDVRSAAVCIRHTARHLARQRHDSFLLLAPLNGSMELQLPGAAPVTLQPRELRLIDNGQPYTIRHGDGLQTLCLDIPHALLERVVPRPARLVGIRPMGGVRIEHSLLALLDSLSHSGDSPTPTPTLLTDALVNLVGAAFACNANPPSGATDRVAQIRAAIEAHATNASLRQLDIANLVGLSDRSVRLVLKREGESFGRYLLRCRLERAARQLRAPALRHLGILQVALDCGFNNATHFGHAFKRRFGMTPSHYRSRPDG